MLELYHAEPGANSLKVLLGVHEKQVEFKSTYLRLNKFEQHEPWFVKINPNGQVPVAVHNGRTITESTVINEYVDEVFEGPRLRPSDPYLKAQMRVWTKFVDEYFCPSLSFIARHHMIKHMVADLSPEDFEAYIERIPLKEQQDKWRTSARQGYTKEQLDEWSYKVRNSIARMEKQLAQTPWLAGDDYSLADIACFAMAANMPSARSPDLVSETVSPRVYDWHQRIMEREGTQKALNMPNLVRETMAKALKDMKLSPAAG